MKKFILILLNFSFSFACCCYPNISCRIVNPKVKKSVEKAKIDIKNNDKRLAEKIKKINQLMNQINNINYNILILQDKINALDKTNSFILSQVTKTQLKIKNLKLLIIKNLALLNNSIITKNKQLLLLINENILKEKRNK